MNPQCCQYAKDYIVLHYERNWDEEDSLDKFKTTPPDWIIRGVKPDMQMGKFEGAPYKINVCPVCSALMPKIRLKAVLPNKIMMIVDGGYYCDTCEERLDSCECKRPEEMWEVDDGK